MFFFFFKLCKRTLWLEKILAHKKKLYVLNVDVPLLALRSFSKKHDTVKWTLDDVLIDAKLKTQSFRQNKKSLTKQIIYVAGFEKRSLWHFKPLFDWSRFF